MAISTASGPWRSLAGFIVPITYVHASDVVGGVYQIQDAGARILVLSSADGGPTGNVTFRLPVITTPSGAVFTEQNVYPELNGIQGSITVYSADHTYHLLGGVDANGNTQKVNGSASGIDVSTVGVYQWGGNGNPDAPWLAIYNALVTPI